MNSFHQWGRLTVLAVGLNLAGLHSGWAAADSTNPASGEVPAPSTNAATAPRKEFILNVVPKTIDAMPTVLPSESDRKIVPEQIDTQDISKTDRRHQRVRQYLQRQAHKIDDWFGEPDPDNPARASLRVLADSTWNEYDDVKVKPRIRGKIRLPTLEKRFSVVFGDDSLDDEIRNNVAITNSQALGKPNKTLDSEAARRENNSIAIRWSDFFKTDLFDTDFDVGLRSGVKDVYGRVKISRDWQLEDNFSTRAEQIYRYGSKSENYVRTNLEIRHREEGKPFIADQAAFTYADENKDIGVSWENRLFRQHAFFHDNTFSYGLFTGGSTKGKDQNNQDKGANLNSYGPFVSWRQPFLRDWFFVQGDLNYFNDKLLDRDHYVSAFLRLETVF